MRVLVVGSGGREHALVWKLAQEAEVFCTPGNAGIALECETAAVKPDDTNGLAGLAMDIGADLVVIGPEDPLIAGVTDALRSVDVPVVGPGVKGAALEGSKAFSKRLMVEAGVPTADFGEFTDPAEARSYVAEMSIKGKNVAVKASGAALGKGVAVCLSQEEADEAIERTMVEKAYGPAGDTVVVEECLFGKEFSLMTLVSGTSFRSLPVAQDYKRAYEGDRGPNTGGMGSFSPVGWMDERLVERAEQTVVAPILAKLADKGIDYCGVLYSGLMVVDENLFCLEYNVRFGDPETQTVVRRLGDGFAEALRCVAAGEPVPELDVKSDAAITVVMASDGYPGNYQKGRSITVPPDLPPEVVVFHAGTSALMGGLVTSGGRVLGVSATGGDLGSARQTAYAAVERIEFKGCQYRNDIGA